MAQFLLNKLSKEELVILTLVNKNEIQSANSATIESWAMDQSTKVKLYKESKMVCSKILVVDDEINIRKILYRLLADEGYNVELASNAEEALENIKGTVFDLIISDISMPPGMNGFELLKEIRAMNVDSAMIFITGYGTIDSAVEAMKLGVINYIEKPLDMKQFKSLVSETLNEQRLQRDIAEDKLLVYTLERAIFDGNLSASYP